MEEAEEVVEEEEAGWRLGAVGSAQALLGSLLEAAWLQSGGFVWWVQRLMGWSDKINLSEGPECRPPSLQPPTPCRLYSDCQRAGTQKTNEMKQ